MRRSLRFALGLLLLVARSAPGAAVDFNRHIRPLLSRNCFACHGPDDETRQAGLRLDLRDAATAKLDSGERAIVPGDPDASELVRRISSTDPDLRMPPPKSGHELTPAEIDLVKRWIAEGGAYSAHWSFVKPAPPIVSADGAPHPIDALVRRELVRHELTPSPEADRATLLRRASLDLRGLPPTPEELDEFLADDSPDAYERLLDQYFASPSYGERWARMWLDLARFADSAGYGSDPLRLNMWRYRDWVIDAFNRNLPYDQFTIEQLAGDLLPDATLDQRIATAFHRNTMTNSEGGTDDEEFRTYAVWDRVDTTLQVWMGLTMGCAKCHNHKYDPITQQEYYRVFAILNQTADRDQPDESPVIEAPDGEYLRKSAAIEAEIAAVRRQIDADTPELRAEFAAWEKSLAKTDEWTVVLPTAISSLNGTELKLQSDQSLLADGPRPEKETYEIQWTLPTANITALRLETIPDASLPGGGAGRADNGNFVLSGILASVRPANEPARTIAGRYVRIERTGAGQFIHLAEVEVFSSGKNVARGGKATQSTTDYGGEAARAIDGNTNGDYYGGNSVTHTAEQDNPWWEVDLGNPLAIERIVVWNRTDNGTGARMTNLKVAVLDAERKTVWDQLIAEPPHPTKELAPTNERLWKFAGAYADYSQPEFSVELAVDPAKKPNFGWAVGPRLTEPHHAVFVLAEPVTSDSPVVMTVRLIHESTQAQGLGRFRLSTTGDAAAARRIGIPGDVLQILDAPAETRTAEQSQRLMAYYRTIAPSLKGLRDQWAALEKSRPPLPTVPVLQELEGDQRRKTTIFLRGNFLSKGPEVEPGFPSAFHSSANSPASPTRLDLARWLVDPENPLTARVAANRFWAQLFGAGLVTTEEDFGAQGELPSHPELLDWLAVEFQRRAWDMKQFLRTIVTSATYRQSAKASLDAAAKDPRNRWLARGPRFRLEAELVRDQALAVSGLLSRKIGGPSVYPYQPAGLWQAAFNGQRNWTESPGEDKFRRGLYTFWRRTVPYPSMATFDAPSREICAVRRVRTNTPLQAFVTLNDPAYVEISQAFARRVMSEGGSTPEERAAYALKLVLCRVPEASQIAEVVRLYQSEVEHYRSRPQQAVEMATQPLGLLPAGIDPAVAAAWTVVANMLLNLDAVLTRG
jgi:mono/diheme cytochrome c family protein